MYIYNTVLLDLVLCVAVYAFFRMDMVISAGKSRKNVDAYVLLPPDTKEAIDLLNSLRDEVGVPVNNENIFASTHGGTYRLKGNCGNLSRSQRTIKDHLNKS